MNNPAGHPNQSSNNRESDYNEFVSLLARHDQAIRRFIRSLLPSQEGVDDVMQETALECWKKYSDFSTNENEDSANAFIRWSCVIARYKAMSWQRDKSRDRLVFREAVIEQLALTALDSLDQQESERQAIDTCLSKLKADQRRLVLSVHSPGESIAEIANQTGQNARQLYSKVNSLRKILLNCVQQTLVKEIGHE